MPYGALHRPQYWLQNNTARVHAFVGPETRKRAETQFAPAKHVVAPVFWAYGHYVTIRALKTVVTGYYKGSVRVLPCSVALGQTCYGFGIRVSDFVFMRLGFRV